MRAGDVFGTAAVLHHPKNHPHSFLKRSRWLPPNMKSQFFFVPKSSLKITHFEPSRRSPRVMSWRYLQFFLHMSDFPSKNPLKFWKNVPILAPKTQKKKKGGREGRPHSWSEALCHIEVTIQGVFGCHCLLPDARSSFWMLVVRAR